MALCLCHCLWPGNIQQVLSSAAAAQGTHSALACTTLWVHTSAKICHVHLQERPALREALGFTSP